MKAVVFLLLAGSGIHFDISDGRGKKASGVTIQTSAPDADGWCDLNLSKSKGDPILIWPFDGRAKVPDGPEPIPAIVIQRGDSKALMNLWVAAAIATPVAIGVRTIEETAAKTDLSAADLKNAFTGLELSRDPFEKGLGLLLGKKASEAADALGLALKERQRQLTRVPSEIYPAAMLYGYALILDSKFDDASVAFLTASKQRQSDACAIQARADALIRSGKPEAAEQLLTTGDGAKPCQRPSL